MTSRTSAPSSKSAFVFRRGFTLVEMLVVVAIIAVLAGFALPMLLRAYGQATKTRAAMDMQTITAALEAYKQDFGDYPRPSKAKIGFLVLGRALLGSDGADAPVFDATKRLPGTISGGFIQVSPKVSAVVPAEGSDWTANPFTQGDGADGFGFRLRKGAGKVYGPYIDPSKFNNKNGVLLDPDGVAYLYYVASKKPMRFDVAGASPVETMLFAGIPGAAGTGPYAHWDFTQNNPIGSSNSVITVDYFQALLGDRNTDGFLEADESVRVDGPFFLWGAGGDNNFGPRGTDKVSVQDCDDVLSNSAGK